MKHIVFYSGGAGSYATTRRILDTPKYNVSKDDLHLVFTDTQIEDKSLYKFLIQTMSSIYGKTDQYNDLIELCDTIPEPYEGMDKRKAHLKQITELVSTEFPNFHWLRYELNNEAVSPWDIFYRQKFIGNSRVANCSTILKQRMARDFIKQNFKKEETKVYFGIDWSEEHRTKSPTENWSKYASEVIFPLCEEPYITKEDKWALLEREGIEKPDLYKLGFEHNNCGGFCVRAGQGHFKLLLETKPELFKYHEAMEQTLAEQIYEDIGDERTILNKTVKGVRYPLPLSKLRKIVHGEDTSETIDATEFGGCGCFVTDTELDAEDEVRFSVRDLKLIHKNKEI